MGDEYHDSLESRLSHKAAKSFHNGIEKFVEGVKKCSLQVIDPYASILKHPEKPFYALGDIVKNLAEIPVDFYKLCRGKYQFSFDKKVSRSLAFAEAVVFLYGAKKGSNLLSNFTEDSFIQASLGGFIGSEGATALTFFGTYLAYTSIIGLSSKDEKRTGSKLMSALKDTSKASLTTTLAGVLSFASVDFLIVSIVDRVLINYFHFFDISAGAVATIGAVGGALLYTGTAKVALHNSAENGSLKNGTIDYKE